MPRAFFHPRLLFAALALLVLPAVAAEKKKKKTEPLPPRPAQPIPQQVSVERGADIEVYLRVYGRKGAPVTFLIRRPPRAGRVSEVEAVEQEVAKVLYTPPKDRGVTSDRFEFAARDNNGVSASVPVEITITDQPPQLAVPGEQRFTRRLVGEKESRAIEVENRGGTMAEGDVYVGAPWQLDSPAHYRIEPGTRRVFRVSFAPEKAGSYASELTFSSQPGTITALLGVAVAPLEIRPDLLLLAPELTTLVRAGALEITNHTAEPQTLRATLPPELVIEDDFALAPGERRAVIVRTATGVAGEVKATVRFASGAHSAQTTIAAAALPAVIRPLEPILNIGRLTATTPFELALQNLGGVAGRAALRAHGPLQVPAQVAISAGETMRVPVTITSGHTGPVEAEIEIRDALGTQRVAVRGAVGVPIPKLAPAPQTRTTRNSAPRRESGPEDWHAHNTDVEKAIDPKRLVRIGQLTPTSATVEWHSDLSSAQRFAAEIRAIRIDGDQVVESWRPHSTIRTERRNPRVIATIAALKPDTRYTVRLRGVGDDGQRGPIVIQTSFVTPELTNARRPFGWKTWLVAGTVVITIFTMLRRVKARPEPPKVEMKKTQKFV